MKLDKNLVLVAVVAFAVAWWAAHNTSGDFIPNPFVPQRPDRPFLKFVAKAAKTCLWVFMFAEPKPECPPRMHVVRATIGPDGHELIDHAEGL